MDLSLPGRRDSRNIKGYLIADFATVPWKPKGDDCRWCWPLPMNYVMACSARPCNKLFTVPISLHWTISPEGGRNISIGCSVPARNTANRNILTTEALELLANKLRMPLQIQLHLTLVMEAGYQAGYKPITASLIEPALSRQLNDLEPNLTRHGYRLKEIGNCLTPGPQSTLSPLTINSIRTGRRSSAIGC